jgi:magnesium transporter
MGAATRTRVYCDGVLEAEDFALSEVSDHLARPGTVVWVDLHAPDHDDIRLLEDELGLHELAVEDALGEHQRPKLDHYAGHTFLSCHAVVVDDDCRLQEYEINAFFDARWMVTVRKDDRFDVDAVLRRWDRSPRLARHGVDYLLYGLIDVVVDGYFDAVQQFDDFYDAISEHIFAETPLDPTKQRNWFEMRRALVRFHRLAVPMREVVTSIMRRDRDAMPDEMYPYFQDVYDHVIRVTESTDSLRDLVSTIVETNLSLRDYHQNQIMKKVTSWAAIIAVPTLITGFYGMNVPFPGEGENWGVGTAVVLILLVSGALYWSFRRREWL